MDVEQRGCYTNPTHSEFAAASAREQKHNFGPGLSDEPFSHAKAAAAAAAATRCKGVGREGAGTQKKGVAQLVTWLLKTFTCDKFTT